MQAALDGGESWDFGRIEPEPAQVAQAEDRAAPARSALWGAWDRKTNISHFDATKLVRGFWPFGEFLPAQRQPRGTCVARGGSGALNVLQCIQIVMGARLEFKPVSHSAAYGDVREMGGIRGNSDGAVGSHMAMCFKKWGAVTQQEAGEPIGRDGYYSDDLAVKWGAGSGGKWTPSQIRELGRDNIVKEASPVTSLDTYFDAIASGSVCTVASNQGFTMTRGSEGVCRASGSWAHQMWGCGVVVLPTAADIPFTGTRIVIPIAQSWGQNVPDGPLLWPGHFPDYVFGAEAETFARMLSAGDSMIISGFDGWLAPGPLPWAQRYI